MKPNVKPTGVTCDDAWGLDDAAMHVEVEEVHQMLWRYREAIYGAFEHLATWSCEATPAGEEEEKGMEEEDEEEEGEEEGDEEEVNKEGDEEKEEAGAVERAAADEVTVSEASEQARTPNLSPKPKPKPTPEPYPDPRRRPMGTPPRLRRFVVGR